MPIFKCDGNVAQLFNAVLSGGLKSKHSGTRMAFLNALLARPDRFAYVIIMTRTMPQIVRKVFPTA
jgi:hypothetical protein